MGDRLELDEPYFFPRLPRAKPQRQGKSEFFWYTIFSGYQCIAVSGSRVDTRDREVEEYVDLDLQPTHLQAVFLPLESLYSHEYLICTLGNWNNTLQLRSCCLVNLSSDYCVFMKKPFDPNMLVSTKVVTQTFDFVPDFRLSADRVFR